MFSQTHMRTFLSRHMTDNRLKGHYTYDANKYKRKS